LHELGDIAGLAGGVIGLFVVLCITVIAGFAAFVAMCTSLVNVGLR
jgi:hypothetical protein